MRFLVSTSRYFEKQGIKIFFFFFFWKARDQIIAGKGEGKISNFISHVTFIGVPLLI